MNRKIPKLKYFKTKKEQEPYIIKTTAIADEFSVALNNSIYKQMNPNLPEIKVGQEIEVCEEPFAYFKYKGNIYPIYSDDPGQQNYIKLNGEDYGAGSFTSYPYDVEYFIYIIEQQKRGKK